MPTIFFARRSIDRELIWPTNGPIILKRSIMFHTEKRSKRFRSVRPSLPMGLWATPALMLRDTLRLQNRTWHVFLVEAGQGRGIACRRPRYNLRGSMRRGTKLLVCSLCDKSDMVLSVIIYPTSESSNRVRFLFPTYYLLCVVQTRSQVSPGEPNGRAWALGHREEETRMTFWEHIN
jgi:hypothetical protein